MLKVSTSKAADGAVTLRLDGQVAGPWVNVLQGACDEHLLKGSPVVLDLRNVSFADREGIELLRGLANRRAEFRNASPFLVEQMRKETRK
jgi:hypothetical protein